MQASSSYRIAVLIALAFLGPGLRAAAVSNLQGAFFNPVSTATVASSFDLSGYALDANAAPGPGVDAVNVWATPQGGGSPILLGSTTALTASNPCGRLACGRFSISVNGLAPGGYTVEISAHVVSTGQYETAATGTLTVAAPGAGAFTSAATIAEPAATPSDTSAPATAVAYDDKHDVYLLIWEDAGTLQGRFVGRDGTNLGIPFSIGTPSSASAALRFPVVGYSRGSVDDLFLVMYQTTLPTASPPIGPNIAYQVVRYTGQGATGGRIMADPAFLDFFGSNRGTQRPHALVFNPAKRAFIFMWDSERTRGGGTFDLKISRIPTGGGFISGGGTTVTLRDAFPWGGCLPEGSAESLSYTGNAAALDWQRQRYEVSYTLSHGGGLHCPSINRLRSVVLDASDNTFTVLSSPPNTTLCESILGACSFDSAAAYVAERDEFLLAWNRAPFVSDSITSDLVMAGVPETAAVRAGGVLVAAGSDARGAALAYDPDSGRGLAAAVESRSAFISGPPFDPRISLALLDPAGNAIAPPVPQAGAAVTSRPSMVAGRDGQFAVAYTTTGGAVLERIDVPVATPGIHFSNVIGNLDAPSGQLTPGAPFNVLGWAADFGASTGTGVDAVHVWAYPSNGGASIFVGAASSFVQRDDLSAAFAPRFGPSGFQFQASGLPAGTHTVVAYAHSAVSGLFTSVRAVTITVAGPQAQPAMSLDIPGDGAAVPPVFDVGGWAIDRAASSGGGVDVLHVWAYPSTGGSPSFLGSTPANRPRGDVGAAYGAQFGQSGFRLTSPSLSPGGYRIVAYAHSTVTGTFVDSRFADIVVRPGDPLMTIDTPSNGVSISQPFLLAGWAIDRDAATGPGVDAVHVWAYPTNGGSPIFAGTGQLNFARGDVGAVYGAQFTNSGYNVGVSGLPAGPYQIVVYAHSTVTGTFNQSRVITVTIGS